MVIQRISWDWSASTTNWNNQPNFITTEKEVILPSTTSSFRDDLNIDITNLIQDMVTNENYRFDFKLQNETHYNLRQYASSFST